MITTVTVSVLAFTLFGTVIMGVCEVLALRLFQRAWSKLANFAHIAISLVVSVFAFILTVSASVGFGLAIIDVPPLYSYPEFEDINREAMRQTFFKPLTGEQCINLPPKLCGYAKRGAMRLWDVPDPASIGTQDERLYWVISPVTFAVCIAIAYALSRLRNRELGIATPQRR